MIISISDTYRIDIPVKKGEIKMKKKMFTITCLLLALLMMVSGCASSGKGSSENTSSGKEGGLKDFRVILDWYPNAIHSFLYVAQEKGYFAEEGLNVELIAPAGGSDGLTFPAAGKAEVGISYMNDATIGYADEGMDIEVLGAITQGSLNCMLALKENHVTSPADFKGKKIGYTGSEPLRQMIIACAEGAGLTEKDFELIDVGFDVETSLISKNVDAVCGGMINHEVMEMQNAGYEVDYWVLQEFGVPDQYEIIMVAGKSAMEENPELYQGFLNACRRGFADVAADPKAGLDVLFAHEDAENYALNREVEEKSLDILLKMEQDSGKKFLSMEPEVWNRNTAWLVEKGLLENEADADEYVYVEK